MVDPGESVSKTLKREFIEEVEITSTDEKDHEKIINKVEDLLKFGGVEVFDKFGGVHVFYPPQLTR